MKKSLLIAVVAMLSLTPVLQSQITIIASDLPAVGDTFTTVDDTIAAGISPGPAGANQSWNFATLVDHDTFTTAVLDAATYPASTFYTDANLVFIPLPQDSSDDATFAQKTNTELNFLGISFQQNNQVFVFPLDPPRKEAEVPFTFGDSFSDTWGLSLFQLGDGIQFDSAYIFLTSEVTVESDAWGSVTTPAGTFDQTLRTIRTEITYDTTFVWFPGFPSPFSFTSIDTSYSYSWVAKDFPGPVITINLDAQENVEDATYTLEVMRGGTPEVFAGFNADQTTGCPPLTVNFTDQSSDNVDSWNWSFPGGEPISSTDQNPTVTYNATGTYDVTLIVGSPNGADTVMFSNYITILPTPVADFSFDVDGGSVSFSNQSTNAANILYDFGDGNTSTMENPMHTYAMDGEYTVTLIVTNTCGADTISKTVTVALEPVAGFTQDTTSGCAPLTVSFTDQSSDNVTGWTWEFPGGAPSSSSIENPTVTYNQAGAYDVSLTVTSPGGTSTTTSIGLIIVDDVPEAGFSFSVNQLEVTLTNMSTNANSYMWDFGDGNTSNMENPVHTYDANDTYTIALIATNDCGSDTITQQTVIVDVEDLVLNGKITVSPNPAQSFVNFSIVDYPAENLQLRIFSTDGKTVYRDYFGSAGDMTIPVNDWTRGWFIYQVFSKDGEKLGMGKFVIN